MSFDRRSFIGSAIAFCAAPGVSVFGNSKVDESPEDKFNVYLYLRSQYRPEFEEIMFFRDIFNASIGDEILLRDHRDLVIPGEFNISKDASFVVKEVNEATTLVGLVEDESISKGSIVPFHERTARLEFCFQGKTIVKYENTGRTLQIKL
jgi:hypothetical protein